MRQIVKSIPVELDKPRTLRYDVNAYIAFEEATGVDLTSAASRANVNLSSLKTVRALLWAGLLHEEPGLRVEDVGRWLDIESLQAVSAAIHSAISQQGAEPRESEGQDPPTAPA